MRRRPVVRHMRSAIRQCLRVLAVLVGLGAAPALGQAPLSVSGTLVIQGGGTNTSTVKYTHVTVSDGMDSVTISLSAAHPTLVIRGAQAFAATCDFPGDCWDSDLCVEKTATSPGMCGWSGIELSPLCVGVSTLNSKLDDCVGLWARAKREPTFDGLAARTDQCIGAGNDIAVLNGSCPAQRYRDAYDTVVFDVIAASQGLMQTSGGHLVMSDVQTHLKRIGDWYGAYRQLYPASSGDAANQRVWADTSRVLGTPTGPFFSRRSRRRFRSGRRRSSS